MVVFEYNRLWRQVNRTLPASRRLLDAAGFASFLLGARVLSLDPPTRSARQLNLYPEQQMTGLAIRRGSRTACALYPFITTRAADPACVPLLDAALRCADPAARGRPVVMPFVARNDSTSNLGLRHWHTPKSKQMVARR